MGFYRLNKRSKRRHSILHRFLPTSRTARLRLLSTVVTAFFILIVVGILGTGFLFAWYSRDLPRPDKVHRTEGFSTIVYDRNGVPLYDIYSKQNRVPVKLDDIPISVRQSTIAIEDKDFYKHKGFSQRGMLRALLNILFFRRMQGGSTLTQQLVKNVLLTSERTIPRKIKEFILAVQIERRYTKDEILQMYLNEAAYGGATAGIEKAAQYYFGKEAKQLDLVESVILAGLPQAPSKYSPFNPENPDAYIWRAKQVTRRMKEDGYITQKEADEVVSKLKDVKFVAKPTDIKAPHFVFYVRQQLIDRFGEQAVETGGLRVTTTLDWDLQKKAEDIVSEEIDKLKGLHVGNGAAVMLDPKTGEILTMVGSKNYSATEGGAFNIATQALRQPGSSIKPITYAVAFSRGFTPATLIFDVATHFPGGSGENDYIPKNYDGKYRGPIQLRYALANSINIVAVKLQALVGVKEMLKLANEMGVSTLQPTDEMVNRLGLSVVLGGGDVRLLDLTSAFGVFATGGERFSPYSISKVTDSNGKVLFEQKSQKGKRVLSPDVAFLISDILADNDARKEVFGTRSHLVIPGKRVSVKTGTTDDLRDNWTIGYTPSLVTGVWVGNNDNSPMNQRLVSGVTGAAPIWNRIMREALRNVKDDPVEIPKNIIQMEIDSFGGGLPKNGVGTRKEYFIKGTEPTEESLIYKKLKISKSQPDKLANSVEIATGNFEEKEFLVFEEQDPISSDGRNRWQEGINEWVNKKDDPRYHPPTEVSSQNENQVVVSISEPNDKDRMDSNNVRVKARAASFREIKQMELEIDGNVRLKIDSARLDEMINLSDGPHKIKVRALDDKGNSGDSEVRIGIKSPWEEEEKPTSVPFATPTIIVPTPTITP